MSKMKEYLQEHNEREHNYHTDLNESGFDVCIECDLIRRTGGLYEWEEGEICLACSQSYPPNGILFCDECKGEGK